MLKQAGIITRPPLTKKHKKIKAYKVDNKSILESIKDAVNSINWSSETKKQKALELCICIYNLYIYNNGDFHTFRSLSKEFFIKIIKTKSYLYEIKDLLINNSIIEINNSYSVNRGIGKGYRFNPKLINHTFNYSKHSIYHICGPKLETLDTTIEALCGPNDLDMDGLSFNNKVYDYINNFKLTNKDIKVNSEIIDSYVNVVFESDKCRYTLEKALLLAKELDLDLIQYKDKCYIENKDGFIERKTSELKLIFKKSVFDINNKIFRISRNETNHRLDYNLTNMKSDLLNYIEYDGEKLIELDISNAQFAILANITNELDDIFIEKSINGTLYSYIEEQLIYEKGMGKKMMFRVAFDKVKKDQDILRRIFPKTMEFIDKYKGEEGYKKFSNLLQIKESKIMIDGLLPYLKNKGFNYFPIHDALRVKESDINNIKIEINNYFELINFKCNLRVKTKDVKIEETKKEMEIINHKGIGEVEIEKITKEDKKLFLSKINNLKEIGIEPSELIMIELNIFQKEKTCYMYDKWIKSNPILTEISFE